MHKLTTLLISVDYPETQSIDLIESEMEHRQGIKEVSINPITHKALVVVDETITSLSEMKKFFAENGVRTYKILVKKLTLFD